MPFSKEDIQSLLNTNDLAVVRGIEAIYARQTADEKSTERTSHNNGVGFNGTDANILSSFAKQIAAWRAEKVETGSNRYRFPLSPKQLVLARRKMYKYAGQLASVANAKAEVKTAEQVIVEPTFPQEAWFAANRAETAALRAAMEASDEAAKQARVDATFERASALHEAALLAEAEADAAAERAAIQSVEAEDELVQKGDVIRQYAHERGLEVREVHLSPVDPTEFKGIVQIEVEDEFLSLA